MSRRLWCGVAIAAIWLLLLGWTAGLPWNTRPLPQQRLRMNASDFHVVIGAGVEDDSALRVGAVGDDGNALQSIALDHLHAQDFSTLRYRFDEFPRTLELSLIFRRADAPDDVQTVTVPWPGAGWRSVDLRGVPGWQGDIIELGFAEYATPQLAPASVAFRPFRFDEVELWSPSWRGGIGTLYTSWFGYAPWALLSVSALGPAIETVQAPSMTPFLFLGCALSLIAAAVILRWSRPRLLRHAVIAALALWALLDLRWLSDFHGRHQLTEDVYAGKSWSERERLVADEDTALVAEQVRTWLAAQPPARRILVASDSKYTLLRLIYLLLPFDVAPLQQAPAAGVPMPHDALFVLYASTEWHHDPVRGRLLGGGRVYPVEPVFESGDVHIYRWRSAQP
ncbi:MAG: hypothetical protein P4L92_15280 [Rudaea sp.]|nr:hypothetical protein [Rudaea sp.]